MQRNLNSYKPEKVKQAMAACWKWIQENEPHWGWSKRILLDALRQICIDNVKNANRGPNKGRKSQGQEISKGRPQKKSKGLSSNAQGPISATGVTPDDPLSQQDTGNNSEGQETQDLPQPPARKSMPNLAQKQLGPAVVQVQATPPTRFRQLATDKRPQSPAESDTSTTQTLSQEDYVPQSPYKNKHLNVEEVEDSQYEDSLQQKYINSPGPQESQFHLREPPQQTNHNKAKKVFETSVPKATSPTLNRRKNGAPPSISNEVCWF